MDRRAFLTTAVSASATLAQAQSAASSGSFQPLFDGKTLAGWTIQEGPEGAFYIDGGDIVIHESSGFPTWLRSDRQYENFELQGEFFLKGWSDSGIYLHAPAHGRPMWNGMQVHLFHLHEDKPQTASAGAIFPVVPPLATHVKSNGEWNTFRILMDWPQLKVWMNDTLVQDLDVTTVPELRHRFRSGHVGIESLSYPLRFRNFRIRELPSKDQSQVLFASAEDYEKNFFVADGQPKVGLLGDVMHVDGLGYIATKEKYRDFELTFFVRHIKHHNSGIYFRCTGHKPTDKHYEIQLHDVEGAHYATGSLYTIKRASYPRIEAETWYPVQIIVKDKNALVRVNGDTVMEYDALDHLEEGNIEIQAHAQGKWTQFKQIRINRL